MAKQQSGEDDKDEWKLWWDARLAVMEGVLGKSDDMVGHATIPFDIGGAADIVCFHHHVNGIVSVTAELIGCDEQIKNRLGNYELMICQRQKDDWGDNLISQLAQYTLDSKLEPGETMDIGSAVPDGATIAALLFFKYATFRVRGRKCGLLLCLGITADELAAAHAGRRDAVEQALVESGVYPFTDVARKSVLPLGKRR
jgi:suppressor of fused protein SUFU